MTESGCCTTSTLPLLSTWFVIWYGICQRVTYRETEVDAIPVFLLNCLPVGHFHSTKCDSSLRFGRPKLATALLHWEVNTQHWLCIVCLARPSLTMPEVRGAGWRVDTMLHIEIGSPLEHAFTNEMLYWQAVLLCMFIQCYQPRSQNKALPRMPYAETGITASLTNHST